MTGASFVAPRAENFSAWLYRIRPSVAHQGFTRLPDNPDVRSNPFVRARDPSSYTSYNIARVVLPSAEPEGARQPHAARVAPVRAAARQRAGRLRAGPEDDRRQWRPDAARGARGAHVPREHVDGAQGVLQYGRRHAYLAAAGPAGYPDGIREVRTLFTCPRAARGLWVSRAILDRLMVRSGELCVIQRGMKFKVGGVVSMGRL